MTPYRVPVDTTEISYTRGNGEQRSIPIQQLEPGYAFAQGADAGDDAHLAGLYPVARKVMGQAEDDEPEAPKKAAAKKTSEAATPAPPAETSAGTEG